MSEKKREPLIHIAKRGELPWYCAWGVRAAAIVLALVACALICVIMTGENPLQVYETMYKGTFGSARKSWVTFQNVAMLLCVSLAVTPAFKMRFWNLGAEGQALMGCLASASCMILLKDTLPNWALILCMAVTSIAAGAVWALIPTLFKAKWNTNETLFTLMMNYVATQLVAYFCIFWETPKGSGKIGVINQKTQLGWLPKIGDQQYLLNILVVLALVVLMYMYLHYTKHGYEITVVGESENTAHYAGINVRKVIIRTMALCGGIAGIAGYLLTAGVGHTISTGLSGGRGFTAIIVAWLGKLNPFAMMLVAFGLVFMEKGAVEIASQFNLNENASEILTGVLLFFILGCEFFINYRLEFRKHQKEEGVKA